MAYIRAAQNGNFSSPSTWVGGVVPSSGDYACTLTNRITLDIDTSAHLCVNQTDWVAAGGTASSGFNGGFTVPNGATRVLTGTFRYDGSGTGANGSNPLYMNGGSLTIDGGVKYVDGYYPSDTSVYNIIYLAPSSTSAISLTINTIIEYKTGLTNSQGLYYRSLIECAGVTNGMINLTLSNFTPFTYGSTQMRLLGMTGTTGYNIVINGDLYQCLSTQYSQGIYINTTSTGANNQNITLNGTTFGTTLFSGTYPAIDIVNVYNVTFTNSIIVNNSSSNIMNISGLRGELKFNGDITTTTSGKQLLSCSSTGGQVIVSGTIYLNYSSTNYTSQIISLSSSVNFSCNNIVAYSSSILTNATYAILLSTTGNISVGNISFQSGSFLSKNIIQTSTRNGTTTIGSIDCRNMYISSASLLNIFHMSGQILSPVVINGDIYGSNIGSFFDLDTSSIYFGNLSATQSTVTVNGNIYAGSRSSGLRLISGSIYNVTVNGNLYGSPLSTLSTVAFAVRNPSSVLKTNNIEQGSDGKFPVEGRFLLNDATNNYLKIYDKTLVLYTMNSQPIGVIPQSSDVRKGVETGVSVGTLSVPNPSLVLSGVSTDNTVGGLDLFNNVNQIIKALQGERYSKFYKDSLWENVRINIAATEDGIVTRCGNNNAVLPIATLGAISVDSNNKLFNSPTILFDGSSSISNNPPQDYLSFINGQGDFCIEGWFMATQAPSSGGVRMLFQCEQYMNLEIKDDMGIGLWFSSYSNNSYWITVSNVIILNRWQHIAFVRDGQTIRLYVDGNLRISNTLTVTTVFQPTSWRIGKDFNMTSRNFYGNMQDFTVTYGAPRYSGSVINIPTTLYPMNSLEQDTLDNNLYNKLNTIESKTSKLTFDQDNKVISSGVSTGTGGSVDLTPVQNVVDAIRAKTDQLSFSGARVLADSGLTITDYSSRFDTIDSNLSLIKSDSTAIKSKTDEMSFDNGSILSKDQDSLTSLSSIISTISGLEITPEGVKIDGIQDLKQRINTINFILSE